MPSIQFGIQRHAMCAHETVEKAQVDVSAANEVDQDTSTWINGGDAP